MRARKNERGCATFVILAKTLLSGVLFLKLGKDSGEEFFLSWLRCFGFGFDRALFGMLLVISFLGFGIDLGLLGSGGVGSLHDDEENDGDDDEGDDRVDEGAPVDDGGHLRSKGGAMEIVEGEKRVLPLDEVRGLDGQASLALSGREFDDHVIGLRHGEELAVDGHALVKEGGAFLRIGQRGENRNESLKASWNRPGSERGQDIDERVDDCAERTADDDTNGQHERVAAVNERLEFAPNAFSGIFPRGFACGFFFFSHIVFLSSLKI